MVQSVKKIWLIEADNPDWHDLSEEWGRPFEPLNIAGQKAKTKPHGIVPIYEKRIKKLRKIGRA